MGKWVRRQRLQDPSACKTRALGPEDGDQAFMAHTLCQTRVLIPQSLQVTPHPQGFRKNWQRRGWGPTTPAGLGLDPDPLRPSCQAGSTSLSDVILATSSPASKPLLVSLYVLG